MFVLNQVFVAIKDGKFNKDELEGLGKKIYRLSTILDIYLKKKHNEKMTKDEFVKALTNIITEMKETIK